MAEPDKVDENDDRVLVWRGKHWRSAQKHPDSRGRFAISHGTGGRNPQKSGKFKGRTIRVVVDVYQTRLTAREARDWAFADEVCTICSAGER